MNAKISFGSWLNRSYGGIPPVRHRESAPVQAAASATQIEPTLMQSDEGEFRSPIDRDKPVELTLCCAQLGDVDVEVADRVGFEFSLGPRPRPVQARDALPLQTPTQ
jgi:hypothetical protein